MKRKKCFNKIIPVCALGILLLLSVRAGLAQETVVQGLVTDEEGKPIKGAQLNFADPGSGFKFALKTDQNGKYLKVGIPPAIYKVTAEKEGFMTFDSETRIRFKFTETLDLKLKKRPPVIDKDTDLTEGSDSFRAGNYEEAVESFKKVVGKYPSNYEGYYNLGLTYIKKKNFDPAITALEKAAEINRQSLEVFSALGECCFARGETEKAQQNFSRAIELKPESPLAHYNLGLVYYKLGKNEEALMAFDKAIELKPDGASAYYQAGLASIRMEDFQRAVRYFEDFLKVQPDAPEATQVRLMVDELKKRIKGDG